MTGYYIEIGYISGSLFKGDKQKAWERLKEQVGFIKNDPLRIVDEVLRISPHHAILKPELIEFAGYYKMDTDLTITIHDKPMTEHEKEDFEPYVAQLASGSGLARTIKELLRQAVCRLLIESMHLQGIEVNMRVS